MDDNTFYALSLTERMDAVNERMGGIHPDRICTVQDLIDLYGTTLYVVLSPFGQEQDIGNGFIYEWKVGKVTTPDRVPITTCDESMANDVSLICEFFMDDSGEYRALAIKDFNIIPNNHNNHCMFTSREGVDAYAVFRKLKWSEDENLTEIKDEYNFWMIDKDDDDK